MTDCKECMRLKGELAKLTQLRSLPPTYAGEDVAEIVRERNNTREEMKRLVKEYDKLRALVDEACAVVRLPDTTNDGGPGDLAEELRTLKHNNDVVEEENERLRRIIAPNAEGDSRVDYETIGQILHKQAAAQEASAFQVVALRATVKALRHEARERNSLLQFCAVRFRAAASQLDDPLSEFLHVTADRIESELLALAATAPSAEREPCGTCDPMMPGWKCVGDNPRMAFHVRCPDCATPAQEQPDPLKTLLLYGSVVVRKPAQDEPAPQCKHAHVVITKKLSDPPIMGRTCQDCGESLPYPEPAPLSEEEAHDLAMNELELIPVRLDDTVSIFNAVKRGVLAGAKAERERR